EVPCTRLRDLRWTSRRCLSPETAHKGGRDRKGVRTLFRLTSARRGTNFAAHGTTSACGPRRLCLSCAQSRQWPRGHLPQGGRLRGVRAHPRRDPGAFPRHAAHRLLPHAQSLAPLAVATRRRRARRLHALADAHAHAALACPLSKCRRRTSLSGTIQILSHSA